MTYSLPTKLMCELVGTFTLVFVGTGAGAVLEGGTGLLGIGGIALAHALVMLALVYATALLYSVTKPHPSRVGMGARA